ncbi:MAG: molybdate ABC transporter substrate-binding protein, partial [Clostridiales bacterium]|nr:molybdate ABC transporter substrate-binding protein [Clostridiales bacterium]
AASVPDGAILIAAAASLQNAFEKSLIPEFNKIYPNIEVTGTFDSSGRLQTQIEAGLEADLFFSAATTQMNNLRNQGLIDEASVVNLLENKIVLISTRGMETSVTEFQNITDAPVIAIGDPESVPAGQYAQEVFTSLGIWDEVLAKASLGTNVTEVLTWVAAGSAEVGVVYATDAASNEDVVVITEAPAGSLKTPVLYPVGMTADSKNKPQAQAFLDFLKGDTAKGIFESYGFTVVK